MPWVLPRAAVVKVEVLGLLLRLMGEYLCPPQPWVLPWAAALKVVVVGLMRLVEEVCPPLPSMLPRAAAPEVVVLGLPLCSLGVEL